MIALTTAEVGKWDEALFLRFKRARGETKRALLSELLRVNGPLVKILVGQIAGIADEKTPSHRRRPTRMRVPGADQIPWEDLMQAGLQGFAHALNKFDPARGKISGYARWWILTNIQRMVRKEALIKTPERETAIGVALLDDETEIDRLSTEHAYGGTVELPDGMTEAMILGWQRSGRWPTLEEWTEQRRPKVAYSVPRCPFDLFIEARCTFAYAGRAPAWPLWNAWRVDCSRSHRAAGSRTRFLSTLAKRGVRETRVWNGGSPVRGLAGVRVELDYDV